MLDTYHIIRNPDILLPKENGEVAPPGKYNYCEKIESLQWEYGILARADLTDTTYLCMAEAEAGTYFANCPRYDGLPGEFRGPLAK